MKRPLRFTSSHPSASPSQAQSLNTAGVRVGVGGTVGGIGGTVGAIVDVGCGGTVGIAVSVGRAGGVTSPTVAQPQSNSSARITGNRRIFAPGASAAGRTQSAPAQPAAPFPPTADRRLPAHGPRLATPPPAPAPVPAMITAATPPALDPARTRPPRTAGRSTCNRAICAAMPHPSHTEAGSPTSLAGRVAPIARRGMGVGWGKNYSSPARPAGETSAISTVTGRVGSSRRSAAIAASAIEERPRRGRLIPSSPMTCTSPPTASKPTCASASARPMPRAINAATSCSKSCSLMGVSPCAAAALASQDQRRAYRSPRRWGRSLPRSIDSTPPCWRLSRGKGTDGTSHRPNVSQPTG